MPRRVVTDADPPSSAFALLGFTNGDTLRSVNGVVLDSTERGLEVFTSLRAVSSVIWEITRAGRPMTITYRIGATSTTGK